jgi:hypothetical protein
MPKTRRKKINKRPLKLYQNSKVIVVEQGMGVKVAGYRSEGKQVAAKGESAKAIHIGRVYTGVSRGKTYPYAGKKRGGAPLDDTAFGLAPRKIVGVIDG